MTTSILDAQWTADPTQPGRIVAGEAVTIEVRVAFWRVVGGASEEARLVKETEALVVAAPAMAKALLMTGCRDPVSPEHSAWHTHDCWENRRASCSEACKATVAALKAAGITLP